MIFWTYLRQEEKHLQLREIQELFKRVILENNPDALNRLSTTVTNRGRLETDQRIAIYSSNVRTSHRNALRDVFPVCERLVGAKYFKQLAGAYLEQYPSQDQDLNFYGNVFPEFLEQVISTRAEAASLPYLPHVARLEWHYHQAYYAEQDPPFDFTGFSELQPDEHRGIMFRVSKSLALFSAPYDVLEIWKSNREERDDAITLRETVQHLVIWRSELTPCVEAVAQPEYEILSHLERQSSLQEIIGRLDTTDDVPQHLPHFINKGWIIGYQVRLSAQ